ncbi:hypothetical protein BX286_1381 [Streptomyces sp. 3211.6]|uniref:hypothetical protein n=1 Tax=Streptomyces sp. 3211.6 TaxID=1938845 RepID=UPI000EB0280A|nr:hypothetical protein [Streptomyces sp. 3211.6]RKT03454.1 hypothetical protein BX286_1381 [Streptomyces sp. 3211.6]
MTTAEHLDTIDRLRARAFPAGREASGEYGGGPGHHLVGLSRTRDFWEDDGSGREEAADQINAEYGALVQALTDRWGAPQVFALDSLLYRQFDGEEIPEPWQELCGSTDHVHLWRAEDRWLLVCVTQWDKELPFLLTAGVTVVDPP